MQTEPVRMNDHCQPKKTEVQSHSGTSGTSSQSTPGSGRGQLAHLSWDVHHSEVMLYRAPKRVPPNPLDMFIRANMRPRTSSSKRSATMLFATGSNPARQAPLSPRRRYIIGPH